MSQSQKGILEKGNSILRRLAVIYEDDLNYYYSLRGTEYFAFIEKDMNQEGLSELVHLSQPAVSKYEKMKVIDDEMLQRFARALNVPFDYLKTLEEDAQTVVFENNTVNNSEQSAGGANISMGIVKSDTEDSINDSRVNNFNPIDKITELYERLLKEKDEKYAALERRLQNIEKSLQK